MIFISWKTLNWTINSLSTTLKMKFSITDFVSKCDQIRRKLRIWTHILEKSVMENFIFCAVIHSSYLMSSTRGTYVWYFDLASKSHHWSLKSFDNKFTCLIQWLIYFKDNYLFVKYRHGWKRQKWRSYCSNEQQDIKFNLSLPFPMQLIFELKKQEIVKLWQNMLPTPLLNCS